MLNYMKLTFKKFDELTTTELYEILKARAEIFIVEQQINYQDMDDIDYQSLHCFIKDKNQIIAYLRAFQIHSGQRIGKGKQTDYVVKIGRVLTITHGTGLGRALLEQSLPVIKETFPDACIYIEAQTHAVGFYEKFGFVTTSDTFLEEGIMHVAMELQE